MKEPQSTTGSDPEDIAAALAAFKSESVGFLPGSRSEKQAGFNKAVAHQHDIRVARDNSAAVTSHNITTLRPLRFR